VIDPIAARACEHPVVEAGRRVSVGGILVCLAIFAATAAVLLSRVYRGIDFTDESFNAALAYRFVLGDEPFRDELAVHQSAALLTVPAVWFHDRLAGGPDGMVRFLRLVHFGFLVSLGALIWSGLRRFLGDAGSLLAAALFVAAYPTSSLNYNSLGSGLVAASLCLALLGESPGSWRLAASGLAAGLAAVAYPPLALWVVFLAVGLFAILPNGKQISGFAWLAAGAAAALLPFAVLLFRVGPRHVLDSIVLTNETANKLGGFRKFLSLGLYLYFRLPLVSVLIAVAFTLAVRLRPRLAALRAPAFLAALSAACLGLMTENRVFSVPDWPKLFVSLSLLTPFLLAMLADSPARRAVAALWVGSAAAGLVTAYFTTSSRENFGRSGTLIAFAAACWLAVRSESRSPRRAERLWAAGLAGALGLLVGAVLMRSRGETYRDRPLEELTYRVANGPFAGIRTSRRRYDLIRNLQADLAASVDRNDFVIFYDDFPAGFLMSRRRPGLCGVWVFTRPGSPAFRNIYVDCVHRMARAPLSVIRLNLDARDPLLAPVPSRSDDPFGQLVERCGRPVLERDSYEILRLDPRCNPAKATVEPGTPPGRPPPNAAAPARSQKGSTAGPRAANSSPDSISPSSAITSIAAGAS
jgi:hypothetical protein